METKPKVLKWALIIGIVVVLNLFFNYTISLFYKEPDYNTFFPQQQVVEPITNKDACLKVGGQWIESPVYKDGKTVPVPAGSPQVMSYCNPDFTKQQEFSDAQKVYQRNIFIILVVLGVLSLVLGVFLANEIITLGLSWGGVLSLVIASMRYWSTADNLIKVLILGFALAALVWLAVRKFGKNISSDEKLQP
ncbi:MAG: hypothetical protein WCS86_00305 [Candidatus Paceibacterota bacterium]